MPRIDIVNIARQRGTNCVSFGVAGKKCDYPGHARSYFSTLIVDDRQPGRPFFARFLADAAWHYMTVMPKGKPSVH